jgi:hypothetical protein
LDQYVCVQTCGLIHWSGNIKKNWLRFTKQWWQPNKGENGATPGKHAGGKIKGT